MTVLMEEHLRTPVVGRYDVIVAGGGPAGVPAAVRAARHGARVLLLENNGCLGGVWTAGILAWVFDIEDTQLGHELTERLAARRACVFANGANMVSFTYDVETMKVVLEEMCMEGRVDVRLHTRVVAAHVDECKRLRAVVTESKSGRQAFTADAFIDCTGDGDLGALAGNAFEMGAEDDGRRQPMTMMGLMAVRDVTAVADHVSFHGGRYSHVQAYGRFKSTLGALGIECQLPRHGQRRGHGVGRRSGCRPQRRGGRAAARARLGRHLEAPVIEGRVTSRRRGPCRRRCTRPRAHPSSGGRSRRSPSWL